jgi:hypothetical protein
MKTVKPNYRLIFPALLVILSISLASCNIPLPFQTPTAPVLSDAVLTQAAATIFAEVGATQTQLALAKPSDTPTIVIPSPAMPSSTQEIPAAPPPEASPTAYPPPEASPTPAAPPLQPSPLWRQSTRQQSPLIRLRSKLGGPVRRWPLPHIIPLMYRLRPRIVQMGTHFYVDNVNLAMCYGYYWAVFAIYNNGTNNLESASITVHDLSTGRYLYGPVTDNYPFMWADNTCEAGYLDTLISGGMLFVGGRLNDPAIKFHTLGATIKLCSKDSLQGACFTKNMEFVVPYPKTPLPYPGSKRTMLHLGMVLY